MGRFSRSKGARGELAASKFVSENLGVNARRGRQFSGSPDSPDVVIEDKAYSDLLHLEIKAVEKPDFYSFVKQARGDSGGRLPVVMWKRARGEWLVVIPATEFFSFIKYAVESKNDALPQGCEEGDMWRVPLLEAIKKLKAV